MGLLDPLPVYCSSPAWQTPLLSYLTITLCTLATSYPVLLAANVAFLTLRPSPYWTAPWFLPSFLKWSPLVPTNYGRGVKYCIPPLSLPSPPSFFSLSLPSFSSLTPPTFILLRGNHWPCIYYHFKSDHNLPYPKLQCDLLYILTCLVSYWMQTDLSSTWEPHAPTYSIDSLIRGFGSPSTAPCLGSGPCGPEA